MKISACWIVKNEEKNIERSIRSVASVVDEIVVIDTGSTDNTVDIATECGAIVHFFEWINNFSAAKNYALSKISGDLTFFLDADEWFEPALDDNSKMMIESLFQRDDKLAILNLTIQNLNDFGTVKNVTVVPRVLRINENMGFVNAIHEEYKYLDNRVAESKVFEGPIIKHSGYTDEVMPEKMKRNVSLLEMRLLSDDDAATKHLNHLYLVREYCNISDYDASLKHLKAVLASPDLIIKEYKHFNYAMASLIYTALHVARMRSNRVSKLELKRKMLEPYKKIMRDYRGVASADLFFDLQFEPNHERLIANIDSALAKAKNSPYQSVLAFEGPEQELKITAARAMFLRGEIAKAFDYAVSSFESVKADNNYALSLLMHLMKGQADTEVIMFLNSQFDLAVPQKLVFLANATRIAGFDNISKYYLNKLIMANLASYEDFAYFLILNRKYGDAAYFLQKQLSEGRRQMAHDYLFVLIVCSRDYQLYQDNMALLSPLAPVLDAYFANCSCAEITSAAEAMFSKYYPKIALLMGFDDAEQLANVYSSKPKLVYYSKLKFCDDNCMHRAALDIERPSQVDFLSEITLIECQILCGEIDSAAASIEALLRAGMVNYELLNLLSAVCYRANADNKAKLLKLYNSYNSAYVATDDMRDVIETGYFVDDSDKKRVKALKSLTAAQFLKLLEESGDTPCVENMTQIALKCAEIYMQNSVYSSAIDALCIAAAHSQDKTETMSKLAEIFKTIGNNQVAEALTKML